MNFSLTYVLFLHVSTNLYSSGRLHLVPRRWIRYPCHSECTYSSCSDLSENGSKYGNLLLLTTKPLFMVLLVFIMYCEGFATLWIFVHSTVLSFMNPWICARIRQWFCRFKSWYTQFRSCQPLDVLLRNWWGNQVRSVKMTILFLLLLLLVCINIQ